MRPLPPAALAGRFEKLAEDCKQNMEILKQAHARGCPPPKYHYEQRTFSIIKYGAGGRG